jgi:hypothetical protein
MDGAQMVSYPESRLSKLQKAVLDAFFERERAFFLTGGAALAGFHLGHRTTKDLDLFTHDAAAFERGVPLLRDVARALGLVLELRQDAPGFKRALLSSREDALVVDLVLDETLPAFARERRGKIELDPPGEILANKLTAIVGRSEERDLVDVMFLERAGLTVENALPRALEKDGGCTPAQLAWLLSQIEVPDGATLPAGIEAAELRDYVAHLIERLRRLAHPQPH